tara:strand:- start:203 stop:388 length:186 start_codon:yes stop_codon:yes gene_type:complete
MDKVKIYTLTVAYNEETEQVEYLQEEVHTESPPTLIPCYITDYWDEESMNLLKHFYSLAKA